MVGLSINKRVAMKYLKIGDKIIIKCSVGKCPRQKRYTVQEGDENTYPEGTVVSKLKCPWHDDGDFDQEQFYDKDGKELYWEPPEESQ